MVTLQGLPPILETFITTLSNNNLFPTFDELIGKRTQEDIRMIGIGKIQKREEGEPFTFFTQDKKKKGKGRPSNQRNDSLESKESKRRLRKEKPPVERYNRHKYGHYARDCPRKRDASRSNQSYKNNRYYDIRINNDRRRGYDRRS